MTPSDDVLRFLKHVEGFSPRVYPDAYGWSIGHGTFLTAAEIEYYRGREITEKDAEDLLRMEVFAVARQITALVRVPLAQGQFDALVIFAYNIGTGEKGFGGSDLLEKLNAGDYEAVPLELARWVYARIGGKKEKRKSLVARRAAEAAIFRGVEVRYYNA